MPVHALASAGTGLFLSFAILVWLGEETPNQHIVRLPAPAWGNPAEPSVSINPSLPSQIVAVSLARRTSGEPRVSNWVYESLDGGRNWDVNPAPNPERRVQGDDSVVFGEDGQLYHSYISFVGLRDPDAVRRANGIFVRARSRSGKWASPIPVVDHPRTVNPFEDKPYLGVDRAQQSEHRGNVYIAWTRFDEYGSSEPGCESQIYFSRSTDQGGTFSEPKIISDQGGDCLDSDNTVEGAVPAVGAEGEVLVAWAGPRGLEFDRSLDGGETFGLDRLIAKTPGGWDSSIEGIGRHNGFPVTVADTGQGPWRGSIYVNWIDERTGEPNVFLTFSRDLGLTWSPPVQVNEDGVSPSDQFFTWMAVDSTDGSVNVVFYDRSGLSGTETKLTLARSTDGGQSFQYHPVALTPFETNAELFFGDYLALAAESGQVVAVFPHFIDDEVLALSATRFNFR